ncbi:hypothetical protein C8J56DRAFT_1051853 [Mycena floridula]|nr:hypothetical protein C8J56DRAFT_1051853 [Mycena floridula]
MFLRRHFGISCGAEVGSHVSLVLRLAVESSTTTHRGRLPQRENTFDDEEISLCLYIQPAADFLPLLLHRCLVNPCVTPYTGESRKGRGAKARLAECVTLLDSRYEKLQDAIFWTRAGLQAGCSGRFVGDGRLRVDILNRSQFIACDSDGLISVEEKEQEEGERQEEDGEEKGKEKEKS